MQKAGEVARNRKRRKDMVKVGDVCPLLFSTLKDRFAQDIDWIQRYHSTDHIVIQLLALPSDEVSATVNDLLRGSTQAVDFTVWELNENVHVHQAVLTGMEDGVYTLTVEGVGTSEPWQICSTEQLKEETMLVRYSHKDNNSVFDNAFWVNDEQVWFEFRVEAGFKASGYTPKVDNEQYRNQRQEIVELYAMPYDSYTLTIGNACGVPYWVLRHINRVLCLSDVEMDGKGYVRSENGVPEKTQVSEDSQLFQATITLEPRENSIAGIGGKPEAPSGSAYVGFAIENPVDGQMLQYSGMKQAFENVTTVGV